MLHINNNTKFSLELIVDLLITALEGGSNYWYFLPTTNIKAPADYQRNHNIYYEFIDKVIQGAKLPVHDAENEIELLGYLTINGIEKGIE
ncbi:MAG: hypothetical protein ACOCWM_05645, partial [Cyclobacteriaceae bacterium]